MVLLLVAAAYAMVRALEKAGTKWIVAAGVLLGFAFLAKMLQAFTVLPAFAAVYLLAAPTRLRRRLWQLAVGAAAIVAAAGWWVATVALWPAGVPADDRRLAGQQHPQPHLRLQRLRPDRQRRWGRWRWGRRVQRGDRSVPPVQRPDGRPGLLAPAGRPGGAGGRRCLAGPGAPDRPHPGRPAAVGRLARRDRRGLQLRSGRHPHLLHRRPGSGHRRPRRHRRPPRSGATGTGSPPACSVRSPSRPPRSGPTPCSTGPPPTPRGSASSSWSPARSAPWPCWPSPMPAPPASGWPSARSGWPRWPASPDRSPTR